MSDGEVSKDDTLGIAGHKIGNVGKCHLYGAYILSYKVVGNFQRILDEGVKLYEQQMHFTTVEGWIKLWYFYRLKICLLIMFLDKCLSGGSLWIMGFQLICAFCDFTKWLH